MTPLTVSRQRSTASSAPRLVNILHSEWIKLSTMTSTWICLVGMLILGLGAGVFAVSNTLVVAAEHGYDLQRIMYDLTMVAGAMCPVFAGILGVMSMGAEYSSGTIQPTMLAVPGRLKVLWAKALVLFTAVSVVAAIMIFRAWAIANPMMREAGMDVSLASDGVLGSLLGTVLYLALTAVFGLGVAAIVRSTTAGAIIIFTLSFLGPGLSMLLPAGLASTVLRMLVIGNGGYSMVQMATPDAPFANGQGYLSPAAGAVLVVAWTFVSLIGGAIALRKRDV